jgi:hypothetical protein
MGDADAVSGALRRWFPWIVLVVVSAAIPMLVASRVFPNGSPDRDDAGYLSQASALKSGQLTLPADDYDPFFLPFLSGVHDGKVVFKYQPAWPALIAASETITGSPKPALAVTGAASALAVAAVAIEVTRRRRAALTAGFLFATSPWFVIQSGTYLAYPASTALLGGATALVVRGVRTGAGRLMVAAGAVMALGVLHRPYDAVLGLVPLGVWYLVTRWRSGAIGRDLSRIALGAAPFAVVFFAYNRAVTGKAFSLAFSLVGPHDRFGFGNRSSLADPGQPGFYDFTPGEAWRTVLAFSGSLLDWLPGGLLVLVFVYLGYRAIGDRRLAVLVLAQGLIFPVGYFVWWGAANAWSYGLHDLLGPLYWFPLLATVAVLGGAGIDHLATTRPSVLRRVPAAAVPALAIAGLLVVSLITGGDTFDAVSHARRNQNAMVASLAPGPGERTLTLAERTFDGDLYVPVPVPASLDGDHLIAMDPAAGAGRFDLLDRFPGRTFVDVLEVHRPDEPFEAGVTTRRELSVRSGATVALPFATIGPGTPTVEVDGERQPLPAAGGEQQVVLAAEPTAGAVVVPAGDPVVVVIGLDGYELHYLARSIDGEVQVIVPPTPIRHYHFPGHDPVDVIEDVSGRIGPR